MTTTYRASSALAISLASLASSSGLTAGRASASYSNTTNQDDWVQATLLTRTSGTPTAGVIQVWAFAQRADGLWPEMFAPAYTGADAALTANTYDVLQGGGRLIGQVNTDTTARSYTIECRELGAAFQGAVPQNVAFLVVHNCGTALDATAGNHALTVKAGKWS